MSRIHEALMKSQQEKAAIPVGRKAAEPALMPSSAQVVRIDTEAKIVLAPAVVPDAHPPIDSRTPQQNDLLAKCVKTTWNPDPHVLLFSSANDYPAGTEQFRTLRSRLYRIRESKPLSTLLVSSATPGEGKTFVAANLAQALVRQHGCRGLLIDADLRSPKLHHLLGVPQGPGLAEYLQGDRSELDILQKGQEDDLYFIQAGQNISHPSELISNGRLKQLLARVSDLFEWIILDSPPILPVADATVLATMCHGVLFVVRAGITPAAIAQKACQQMQGANIVGVVLNSADDSAATGSYYRYSGDYNLGQTANPQK